MPKAEKSRPQKPKVTAVGSETRPAFQKAKSLFPLLKPDPATEEAWKLYISNRRKASQLHNELVVESDDSDDSDSDDEDSSDEKKEFNPVREFVDNTDEAMITLEKDMGLKKSLLSKGYSVLNCSVSYPGEEEEMVQVLGVGLNPKIEPAGNLIVQFHSHITSTLYCAYILRPGHCTWMCTFITIGTDTRTLDSKSIRLHPRTTIPPAFPRKSIEKDPEAIYGSNGWRLFAHGHRYDEASATGWVPDNVLNVIGLDSTDVQNICEVFWGPQAILPEDADETAKIKRRRMLVDSIHIVLAGAGIDCNIACLDKEDDSFLSWPLRRMHGWMSREIRKTCGFQLKRDFEDISQHEVDARRTSISNEYYEDYGYVEDDYDFYTFKY